MLYHFIEPKLISHQRFFMQDACKTIVIDQMKIQQMFYNRKNHLTSH